MHPVLAGSFQKIIEHTDLMLGLMLKGTSSMLPNKPDAENLSEYRLMVCLPTDEYRVYNCQHQMKFGWRNDI